VAGLRGSVEGFNGALAINLPAVLRVQPATLIATVHDEAVFLVPNDMQVSVADIGRKEMVAAFLDVFPNAPTVNLVEPKIGSNWGDLHFMTGRPSTLQALHHCISLIHRGAIMPPPQPSGIST
jgi:hypothetical protein